MHLYELVGMGMMKEEQRITREKNRNIVIFKIIMESFIFRDKFIV